VDHAQIVVRSFPASAKAYDSTPVSTAPEEEEQTGHVVSHLTVAQTRCHTQEHACFLHTNGTCVTWW